MIYFVAALFGAWFVTASFYGYLYLQQNGFALIVVPAIIGAMVGAATAALFVWTHT